MMQNNPTRSAYQCSIRLLSPLHIGNGEKLNINFDFFSRANRVYLVNTQKLFNKVAAIGQEGIAEFTAAIENRRLAEWLERQGIRPGEIAFAGYSLRDPRPPKEILVQIRDGLGNPYIPGSSLKGALRTAILRKLLLLDQDYRVQPRKGKKRKFVDHYVCAHFLGDDPKESLMRCLTVGDSSVTLGGLDLAQVWVTRLTSPEHLSPKFPLYAEVLRRDSKAGCVISFDGFLPAKDSESHCFGFKARLTLEWLLDACKALSRHTIETELEFFDKKTGKSLDSVREFYSELQSQLHHLPSNETIVQMAWGSGWKGMTGQLLEARDLTNDTRKELGLATKYLRFPFPKSRRLAQADGEHMPLGWVKLSLYPVDEIRTPEEEKSRRVEDLEKEQREKEELLRQWEGMTELDRWLSVLRNDDIAIKCEGKVDVNAEIWPKLGSFEGEDQKRLALAFKNYWQNIGKWQGKKPSKKQREKVQKVKDILGED